MPEDDDGITIIPIGPGSGTATRTAQFASETADFLRRFANNPAALVISVVSGFVVSVILGFFEFVAGAVLYPFDYLAGGLRWLQRQLIAAFAAVGIDILDVLLDLQSTLGSVVASAGPAGPLIAVGAAAVSLFILYRALLALVVLIPGGDSVLTFLGGR